MKQFIITDEDISAGTEQFCGLTVKALPDEVYAEHVFSEEFYKNLDKVFSAGANREVSVRRPFLRIMKHAAAVLAALLCAFGISYAAIPEVRAYTAKWVENITGNGVGFAIHNEEDDPLPEFKVGYIPDGFVKIESDGDSDGISSWGFHVGNVDHIRIGHEEPTILGESKIVRFGNNHGSIITIEQFNANNKTIAFVESLKDSCTNTEYLNAGSIAYGFDMEEGASLTWYDEYRHCIFEVSAFSVKGEIDYNDVLKTASGLKMIFPEYGLKWIPGNYSKKDVLEDWQHRDVVYHNGDIRNGLNDCIVLSYGYEVDMSTYVSQDQDGLAVIETGAVTFQESVKINGNYGKYIIFNDSEQGVLFWVDEQAGYVFQLSGTHCGKEDLIKAAESIY